MLCLKSFQVRAFATAARILRPKPRYRALAKSAFVSQCENLTNAHLGEVHAVSVFALSQHVDELEDPIQERAVVRLRTERVSEERVEDLAVDDVPPVSSDSGQLRTSRR